MIDLPTQNGDFLQLCKRLAEGKSHSKSHETTIFLWFSYGFQLIDGKHPMVRQVKNDGFSA